VGWGGRERQFLVLSVIIFSEIVEIRETFLFSDMESVLRRLFTDPKYVTLNDLEWPFYVKFCFYASMLSLRDCGFQSQLCANK